MNVAVIIAAYNACETIARAVASALEQNEVSEVIVIDDASSDNTVDAAMAANDGTKRLKVVRQAQNAGPAAARNRGILETTAPFLTILDSDDMFLPGRIANFAKLEPFDLAADNIAFLLVERTHDGCELGIANFTPWTRNLDLPAFVQGNISQKSKQRAEFGFIKPVMRREFLVKNSLRYKETLRLGEDYDLYCRCLALGAKFLLTNACGYLAVERPDSLSGRHTIADLINLLNADQQLLSDFELSAEALAHIQVHAAQLTRKIRHREFLHVKSTQGLAAALAYLARNAAAAPQIASDILADKLIKSPPPTARLRYLFDDELAEQHALFQSTALRLDPASPGTVHV